MTQSREHSRCGVLIAILVLAIAPLVLPAASFAAVTTSRTSVVTGGAQAGGDSDSPSISADGRFIAFESAAANLVPDDTNGSWDIFVRDRLLGTTELISASTTGSVGNGGCFEPAISGDGRFVAFCSDSSNLVASGAHGSSLVFVRDRLLGTTELVSATTAGTQANGWCDVPSISADGRFVTFASDAATLVAGDTNKATDIFVHDRLAHTTERVSVATGGGQANDENFGGSMSADGRYVAFHSLATNLAAGSDTNNAWDVFVHDRLLNVTQRVSVGPGGVQGNGHSSWPTISADGRYVEFGSEATNLVLGDTNGKRDTFVYDRRTGTTERVSVASNGTQADADSVGRISADGRYVAFESTATNLVPRDTNGAWDVFVRDRLGGVTERVSLATGGAQGNANSGYSGCAISADGRDIAFDSYATNLVANDTNNADDIFVADRGQLATKLTRSPSKSSVTFKRKKGIVKFALSVTVKDSRGVRIAGVRVYLQSSKSGKAMWHTSYTLVANSQGVAFKDFKAKKRSTTYYRWVVLATDARAGATGTQQKVVVR